MDRITDFNVVDSTIRLVDAVMNKLSTGTLTAGNLRIGTKALDGDERIIYNGQTATLLYDANGSGSGAAVQFAKLASNLRITAADFLVI